MKSDGDSSVQAEIMRLHYLEGLSIRRIAHRLHVARKTVRRALGRRLPAASTDNGRRPSLLDGYDAMIQKWLLDTPELNSTQVLERLRPHGYTGGISILRERVRSLRPLQTPKVYLTVAHLPGGCVQIDWGDFGFALPGVPRRISAFVALMAYSRKLYVEFVLSQATGSFLRCMDRALEFFGGVTSADVLDFVARHKIRQQYARNAAEEGEGVDMPAHEEGHGSAQKEA